MPKTLTEHRPAVPCFHGGAFFDAIGDSFDDLDRRHRIINADVLDAWFPPAPGVLETLHEHLDWLARTSPPTNCEGLIRAIAEARGVPAECILPGAGSSDLIFRAFARWLTADSRVLLLDPTYGEYFHVCERVLGCTVERFPLDPAAGYRIDPERLHARLQFGGYDLVVLVNPNNPTGQHVERKALENILADVPAATKVWLDEAYLEYVGADQSLEHFASDRENVVVCKSMSKTYALSGMRVAYLCGSAATIESLRIWTPPWVVGLPAHIAAVRALQEPDYYQMRFAETESLRHDLATGIRRVRPEWDVTEGCTNFVLCRVPSTGPTAAAIVEQCRRRGLFVRDVGSMGTQIGAYTVRVAVKDAETQGRMLKILGELEC